MAVRGAPYDKYLLNEIAVGLVLHLDPDRLEADGASYNCPAEARVRGQHLFLCVAINDAQSQWLPLFTNAAPGRVALSSEGRKGHGKWVDGDFHYHPGQVWTGSAKAIANAAARANDKSRRGRRSTLDAANVPEL